MPPAPPKKKLPQVSPTGPKPSPPAGDATHAAPPPPPPAKRPGGPSPQAQAQPGPAAQADPNAPGRNEAEAAGAGNNTTSPQEGIPPDKPPPPVDTEPLRFIIKDEPGQEDHGTAANGTEALHSLMLGVHSLHDQVPPEMWEQVGNAATHLSDAYRQANFGQHEGAVASIGHAAGALDRAKQVTTAHPDIQKQVGDAYDAAVHVGNGIRDTNQSRPPWNPLPVKHRGLPVVTVEGKTLFATGVRAGSRAAATRPAAAPSPPPSRACKTCGSKITQVTSGMHAGRWADREGRTGGAGHYHSPDDRRRDDHGRFA